MAQESIHSLSEQEQLRLEKLKKLMQEGSNPYEITLYDRTHTSRQILENYDTLEGQIVTIAGRMMSRRVMGKASFAHLSDRYGEIQFYAKKDDVGDAAYTAFKAWDIGDILGVKGRVFKTQTGEISVHATEMVLLSKSLHPLPEKFHGLTDTDTRYRQRYLDLMTNPEVMATFVRRSQIMRELRAFLDGKGFVEVDTPILTPFEDRKSVV